MAKKQIMSKISELQARRSYYLRKGDCDNLAVVDYDLCRLRNQLNTVERPALGRVRAYSY